jgi:hypothetical protein
MRRVGEITETVGGLNRNARALSPKYARERGEPVEIALAACRTGIFGRALEGSFAAGRY